MCPHAQLKWFSSKIVFIKVHNYSINVANHMTAVYHVDTGQEIQLTFTSNIRMEK